MTETIFNQRPNPCYKCPDKVAGCHGYCKKPERLKWLAESKKIAENRRNYREPVWARRESYVRKRK